MIPPGGVEDEAINGLAKGAGADEGGDNDEGDDY